MNPMISIIVPVYNVEQYISVCIESILSQTFTAIELILVNDGSGDGSGKICDKYVKLDNRVQVIHQKNGGPANARNTGIDIAKGKYICFVDSDDYIVPDFCEKMLRMLEESSADFSVCQYHKFQDNEICDYVSENNNLYSFISNRDYLDKQLISGFSACAKLYRKEIFYEHRFYEGKIHEDIIWSVELARNLKAGVCCTEEKLYYYRQNNNGIMASGQKKCSPDRVYAGECLMNVAKDKFPDLLEKTFRYGIMFPWSYVDGIYVNRTFSENRIFLKKLQKVLRENRKLLKTNQFHLTKTEKARLIMFSYSLFWYGCNAYTRLFRLYLYKVLGKDAYIDGHGI